MWSPSGRTSFQTRTTGIYRSMISECRRQSKNAGLWQYQTFRHGPILYWTARCALCARNFFFFFFFNGGTSVFLAGPHAVCPFGMADWLNRLQAFIIYTVFLIKKKKCKKSAVAFAASSVMPHGLITTEKTGRGSNTETGTAKPVSQFHHSHRIVDSSRQSPPDIDVCCVSAWSHNYGQQDIWHQEGCVQNKNALFTCTSAACVNCSLLQYSLNFFKFRDDKLLENNDLKFRKITLT